ncbi:hypothetical protein [Pseudomonas hunanensis]|uniref:hypothetical protein n=1 Tax=Pseudomonas hunanensis TaxID=1247546 RepID=UPI00197E88F7|nr:hypothetical protein [Pseudomonas hunanensis]
MEVSDDLLYRETDVVKVGELGREFLRPERLRLKLADDVRIAPIDIGSLAYSVREDASWKEITSGKPNRVSLQSLVEIRRDLIRGLLDSIFVSGGSERSIIFFLKNCKFVIDWCDKNGHKDVFTDVARTRRAYVSYVAHLRDKILVAGGLKPLTCAGRQSTFVKLIEIVHESDASHVTHGVSTIKSGGTRRPEPPREDHVRAYIRVCIDLANSYSDFVLNKRPFPFSFKCDGQDVVVFPSMVGVVTRYTSERNIPNVYNAGEVRLCSVEELQAKTGDFKSRAERALKDAQSRIDQHNADSRSEQRLRAASMAASAYAFLFMLITGAGPSEFRRFEHMEALEVERSAVKKELSSVKLRAAGKVTLYSIGRGPGLHLLRKYLKLREWILDGTTYKYLFFNMEKQGAYRDSVSQLKEEFTATFIERLKGVYLPQSLQSVGPSKARKLKSLVLHELKVKAKNIADLLNHDESMNLKGYAETTIDRYERDFEAYWKSIRKARERIRLTPKKHESATIVGHCDSKDNPSKIEEAVPIPPNCSSQFGCLYCVHYVCHADEEDVHKLLSLQFVVNSIRELTVDLNHADKLFKDLSVRVDFILNQISLISEEMKVLVDSVRRRVYALGQLTPFWERRLQRYEAAGVIF